jgi:protein-S-isoprenylcysteine O-methyltransferase Ste14
MSVGILGVACLTSVWLIVTILRPPAIVGAIAILFATALPMAWRDRSLTPSTPKSDARPVAWLIGFIAVAAPFALLQLSALPADQLLIGWAIVLPLLLVRICIGPIRPFAGTAAMLGTAVLQRSWADLVSNDARLLALKMFFLPLYGLSLFTLTALALNVSATVSNWLIVAVVFAYTIDLSIGLSGYVFASAGTYIQPRLSGWLVCLACYLPVMHHWPAFERVVVQEIQWPHLNGSGALFLFGATVMVIALVLYVSATIAFGPRFANLANRGIITSGPYRLMKHPAYFAHVVNAWVIVYLIFPSAGVPITAELAVVPVAFTILYRLRAVTEEQHLSEDPTYVAYCEWVDRFGLIATIRRVSAICLEKLTAKPRMS